MRPRGVRSMKSRGGSRSSDQEDRVEELTLTVPDLWADHHVLKVRDAIVLPIIY